MNDAGIKNCSARKKLRQDRLKVGDWVEVDETLGVIERVLPRKNELVRPPVANVDIALIVLAPVPVPDFLLVDKLLIKFFSLDVTPIILVNKADLDSKNTLFDTVLDQYSAVCKIYRTGTKQDRADSALLEAELEGKLAVFTGQSAVGKTSLLRVFAQAADMAVGEMSQKTARGKNTTRHSQIFVLPNGGLIADTPGFSAFELNDFTPEDIVDFTPEFSRFCDECKFNNCRHLGEDASVCAVKRAVECGQMSIDRYDRYCELSKMAKQKEDKKYE